MLSPYLGLSRMISLDDAHLCNGIRDHWVISAWWWCPSCLDCCPCLFWVFPFVYGSWVKWLPLHHITTSPSHHTTTITPHDHAFTLAHQHTITPSHRHTATNPSSMHRVHCLHCQHHFLQIPTKSDALENCTPLHCVPILVLVHSLALSFSMSLYLCSTWS